jgi:elongation factor P
MLHLTDLRNGTVFGMDGKPYQIIYSEHSKQGRGGAIMRTKIKDLITGAILDRTFKGSDSFDEVEIERKKSQFLYKESGECFFMDNVSFEQFSFSNDIVGEKINYLKEGSEVTVILYENKPIDVEIPIKMVLEIKYTEPGFKGNTQSTTTKPATLETGAEIQVPLFAKIGDKIVVDTRDGSYVERA